jgi:hypothetical protein
VGGRSIARLAGVDDDHRSALAAQLERGPQTGGPSTDDGNIAVTFDAALEMSIGHGTDARLPVDDRDPP